MRLSISLLAFSLTLGAQPAADLRNALVGAWVGTLEYRDFSEPATSARRVKLPAWLDVSQAGSNLRFAYVYDDGPAKIVEETSLVGVDPSRYIVMDTAGKVESQYAISGFEQLRSGRGVLILTGKGTENNVPVEVKTTLRIGRNILEITRETAPSGQPFAFRHAYTFVRAARAN